MEEVQMKPDKVAHTEYVEAVTDNARKARRREEALLRAAVKPPSGFPKKEIRRFAEEARDEFLLRG
jgi:hypothetical protein